LKVTNEYNTQITKIIVYKGEESGTISTGINNVEQTIGDAAIYNLNGVRVNKVQKGVYVVNGKKVVIK
jgi:DNA-binding beta-propeller fold protein YncE